MKITLILIATLIGPVLNANAQSIPPDGNYPNQIDYYSDSNEFFGDSDWLIPANGEWFIEVPDEDFPGQLIPINAIPDFMFGMAKHPDLAINALLTLLGRELVVLRYVPYFLDGIDWIRNAAERCTIIFKRKLFMQDGLEVFIIHNGRKASPHDITLSFKARMVSVFGELKEGDVKFTDEIVYHWEDAGRRKNKQLPVEILFANKTPQGMAKKPDNQHHVYNFHVDLGEFRIAYSFTLIWTALTWKEN